MDRNSNVNGEMSQSVLTYFNSNRHILASFVSLIVSMILQYGKLKDLTKGMSRELYEAGLQSFYHQGGRVSEIQLFLLKLVKLI